MGIWKLSYITEEQVLSVNLIQKLDIQKTATHQQLKTRMNNEIAIVEWQ